MEAVQRDTGRTRKTACGWNTTASAASTDTCNAKNAAFGLARLMLALSGCYLMVSVYGTQSHVSLIPAYK